MLSALALTVYLCAGASPADQARQAALQAAFPAAERFEAHDVLLTEEQAARLAAVARARVDARLVTFYAARRGAETLGYVVLHTHRVRTKNQVLAVSFELDGRLHQVQIAAFHEPSEYRPGEAWLARLSGKTSRDRLAVGMDLDAISGASLSTRTTAEQTRWLLAAFQETIARQAAREMTQ